MYGTRQELGMKHSLPGAAQPLPEGKVASKSQSTFGALPNILEELSNLCNYGGGGERCSSLQEKGWHSGPVGVSDRGGMDAYSYGSCSVSDNSHC